MTRCLAFKKQHRMTANSRPGFKLQNSSFGLLQLMIAAFSHIFKYGQLGSDQEIAFGNLLVAAYGTKPFCYRLITLLGGGIYD